MKKKHNLTKICPNCKGSGEMPALRDVITNKITAYSKCSTCKGTGKATPCRRKATTLWGRLTPAPVFERGRI